MNSAQTDLSTISTPKTGKKITDFQIPEKFITEQAELVEMLISTLLLKTALLDPRSFM